MSRNQTWAAIAHSISPGIGQLDRTACDRLASGPVLGDAGGLRAVGCGRARYFVLTNATTFAAGVIAAVFIGFGTGGEFDVVPYLLSRHFGLRSLSTLYGLHWTAWGIAGFVGPVLMGRAFDATGSYEIVLLGFASGSVAVATLMLLVPEPVARWAR